MRYAMDRMVFYAKGPQEAWDRQTSRRRCPDQGGAAPAFEMRHALNA